MNLFRKISLVFVLIYPLLVTCQITQKVGEWQSYLPYNDGKWVTQSDDKVYYATGLSVFSIDKEDVTDYMFKSKVNGLSDISTNLIEYDQFNDQLVIAYNNSNIDIIKDGEVINIPNIKNNQNLIGSRRINDIYFFDEDALFFATDFGIVELNTKTFEFGVTIFTDIAVRSIASLGSKIFASTADGIYTIDSESAINIGDFSQWIRLDENVGLPIVYESSDIITVNGTVYAIVNESLMFQRPNSSFDILPLDEVADFSLHFLAPGNNRLIVGVRKETISRAVFIDIEHNKKVGGAGCLGQVINAIEDENGRIWYADDYSSIRWMDSDMGGCHNDLTNSPSAENVSDLDVEDGILYVSTGGVRDNFTPSFSNDGFYIYDGVTWNNYRRQDISALDGVSFLNNYQIALHPDNDKIYVASYYEGLLEFNPKDNTGIHFSPENSTLQGTVGDGERERVSGLVFDEDNILWVNNFGAPKPLHAYTEDGNWYAFDPSGTNNNFFKSVVDLNGYVWSAIAGGGVSVFSHNGTISDPTDDESRLINSSNSELQSNNVNAILVDLDGEVWVGTDQGPVIFDSGSSIFTSENRGSRRKVLQDSIAAFLLDTEDILAMEVDGANRKWFGTRNGIFVQSPDGETLVSKFDESNSPLFDNLINALEYDSENGIMYIGTNKGLQSYRTETLGAKSTHAREVYAFPNPVRPDYGGDIYVKGLARDANVKITDMNGKLVYETKALGGQAVWDGRDYNGRKASTGVYLVFSTGSSGFGNSDSFVTKIMIVN